MASAANEWVAYVALLLPIMIFIPWVFNQSPFLKVTPPILHTQVCLQVLGSATAYVKK